MFVLFALVLCAWLFNRKVQPLQRFRAWVLSRKKRLTCTLVVRNIQGFENLPEMLMVAFGTAAVSHGMTYVSDAMPGIKPAVLISVSASIRGIYRRHTRQLDAFAVTYEVVFPGGKAIQLPSRIRIFPGWYTSSLRGVANELSAYAVVELYKHLGWRYRLLGIAHFG